MCRRKVTIFSDQQRVVASYTSTHKTEFKLSALLLLWRLQESHLTTIFLQSLCVEVDW